MPKTAAVIVIGNEILSGKVHDSNSHFLASELRALGVDLRRITVVPDDVPEIGKTIREASGTFDYVFTSGGVGPTHDDMTMEGVARGFGVPTVKDKTMEEIILRKCGGRVPDGSVLKMAELPEGAELIFNAEMRFPVIVFRNVYIFPGIPKFLREKFHLIKDKFRSVPFHLRKIYVNEDECFIAGSLIRVSDKFPDVSIGSYPNVEDLGYKVAVTLESRDPLSLDKAFSSLMGLLPPKVVVRTE